MHNPPRILIVDDNETNRDILRTRLGPHGYELLEAADGEEAIAATREHHPDLILLDVMMPKIDGIEVCKRINADADLPFIAIILATAKADTKDVVAGLEAGADEYLTKPLDQAALVARVKSMLRVKELTDRVGEQAADLARWNKTLEERVQEQVTRIERLDRLKRFLPPQVAELILTSGDERVLDSQRRGVTVVFCDLRGFAASDLKAGSNMPPLARCQIWPRGCATKPRTARFSSTTRCAPRSKRWPNSNRWPN